MLRNELLFPSATLDFLAENGHRIRAGQSQDTYRARLRQLQNAYPGKRVSEFTEADLLAWAGDPALAAGTQLSRRNIAIAFFQWAHWKGLAEKDPSAYLKQLLKPRNHGVKHHNWLTAEQVSAIVAGCRDGSLKGRRDLVILIVLAFTGLRKSELVDLRWGAVDLSGQTIRLIGKGGKPAELGFNVRVMEALLEWRSLCSRGLGRPVSATDPVLPRLRSLGLPGTHRESVMQWELPLGRQGVWKAVKARGADAGILDLAPHDMRRTFAGLLAEQRPLEEVSKALRHSNLGTTQTYLQKNPRRTVEVGQQFDIDIA